MARKCSVCGKNADTLLVTANVVGNSVFCTDCWKKIPSFRSTEVFHAKAEVEAKEAQVLKEAEEAEFPEAVKEDLRHFYEEKKEVYERKERLRWITTSPSFEGYQIREYLGLVSGEVVLGTGMLTNIEAGIADVMGMESDTVLAKVDTMEEEACLRALKEARRKGANAVISAKLDLESFTNNLMVIMVSGTAVSIEKK